MIHIRNDHPFLVIIDVVGPFYRKDSDVPGFIGEAKSIHHGVIDGVRHRSFESFTYSILKPRSKGFLKIYQ
jgi:hypothetical protein